ncbi:P-loop NTPase fold protein [Photobacterium leiognathi]|uniref:P-loop NTPase fold protein n=1 Tax=Photobacterium leiognathi TaxID=553611 RepID=UPI0029820453|nr:P-loop NTPase fold protein [Photobacterium leiognathi]
MKQVEQIIELLNDTSFPQVVLLDGAWGSGKTHFINHQLINKIKEVFSSNIYFFSLYGISSIDDFRDKIISLSMTEQEEASVVAKYFSKIVDGAAVNMGERGVGAIINGVAGAYKYKLYGELDDCFLILDDLERVADDKIIKNILGECLSLAESKNIKVLVVANESKLSCKDDIEKVFADKYKFSFTHEEIVSILRQEYDVLDDQLANELLLNITAVNSKNIRVLKRAVVKFIRIKNEIEQIKNIILDQALSKVLSYVIRICYAKFECGFSKEEIIETVETIVLRKMTKNEEEIINERQQKLESILDDSFFEVSEKLVIYCCDGLYEFTDLQQELKLPVKSSLLDAMMSVWAQNKLTEEEFAEGVKLLEGFIASAEGVTLYKWFTACDTYIFMLDNKVIDTSRYSKESLIKVCTNVEIQRFQIPPKCEGIEHDFRTNFYDQELNKIYFSKKERINAMGEKNRRSDFSQQFIQSWNNVKNEVYQSFMHSPIYQMINEEVIKEALTCWSNEEVFQFVRFNEHRYRFINIQEYFEPEIEALKTICTMLEQLRAELGFGLKVASIAGLRNCFFDAYTRMENNLGRNNPEESTS